MAGKSGACPQPLRKLNAAIAYTPPMAPTVGMENEVIAESMKAISQVRLPPMRCESAPPGILCSSCCLDL